MAEIKPKNTSLVTVKKEPSTALAKTSDGSKKSHEDDKNFENLVSLLGDIEKAETVNNILAKTTDKSEVHNKLQQIYGAQTKEVYDKIAPLLTSKPSSPTKESAPGTSETYAKYYRRVLELVHNANEAKIVTEIILTSKDKNRVHTRLQKNIQDSSNTRASEIYKLIKPILNEIFK